MCVCTCFDVAAWRCAEQEAVGFGSRTRGRTGFHVWRIWNTTRQNSFKSISHQHSPYIFLKTQSCHIVNDSSVHALPNKKAFVLVIFILSITCFYFGNDFSFRLSLQIPLHCLPSNALTSPHSKKQLSQTNQFMLVFSNTVFKDMGHTRLWIVNVFIYLFIIRNRN